MLLIVNVSVPYIKKRAVCSNVRLSLFCMIAGVLLIFYFFVCEVMTSTLITSSPPQEPFDADEYIERLAWRTPGGGSKGGAEAFDPKRYCWRLSFTFIVHIFLSLNMSQ